MYVRGYDLCDICRNIQRGDAGTVGEQFDSINSDLMAMMVYRGNLSALRDHGRSSITCDCTGMLEHAVANLWE